MFKPALYLSSIFFLLFLACSTATPEIELTPKKGESLLYEIRKDDQPVSFLFGTMHILEPEYYNFYPELKSIILNSDQVIMEIGGEPDPLLAYNLLKLDSGRIEDYFTPEQFKLLINFMNQTLGFSKADFENRFSTMKPFLILQTITQSYFSDQAISFDLEIMAYAKSNQIPIDGFETLEDQLNIFEQIPHAEMANLIISSVENYDKEKIETQKLQRLYSKQKVNKLIPLMKKQSPELMQFEDLFLKKRNQNWLKQIESKLKNKKSLIAVGAAHLYGEFGLINLLRAKGFKITPIAL